MSDLVDHGITVTEISAMDQPIDVSAETVAAFVGRALRGPLNTPVLVRSYAEFHRRFGEPWNRSGLSAAVQQFFEHGGGQLYVVRVANGAKGSMLVIPAEGTALVLRAVEPGSVEQLRAAVDYDQVDEDDLFNLTLQRIDPENGRVIDQELHRTVSFDEASERFVGLELEDSALARIEQPYPHHRPEQTGADYIDAVQQGNDGADLTVYDIVGSRQDGTGLFALNAVEHIDLVYLAPGAGDTDIGPTAIHAAELYCRERGAMLVCDPFNDWSTAGDAVQGMRRLGYASPNLIGYFPRIVDKETRAEQSAGGAIAGMLSRLDREVGTWVSLEDAKIGLNRRFDAAATIDEEDKRLLARAGLNAFQRQRPARIMLTGNRTMGRGNESDGTSSSLSVRRTCLRVVNIIDHSTRWAVFEQPDDALLQHIRAQLNAFFASLADLEVFDDDRYVVECTRLHAAGSEPAPGVSIDIVMHPRGATGPVSLTLQQSNEGLRVAGTAFARTA
ncbi:MAG: hypothetical protein QNJ05_15455 [Woeseiaceae bacterium]|nr:hypothetical protein [Woeseiaceae bacterium]